MPCHTLANELLAASVKIHRAHLFVTSAEFFALHAFYGSVYEALDGWYDRFAERALADGERGEFTETTVKAPVYEGDCVTEVKKILADLAAKAERLRASEDATTLAMIDELDEYLGKLTWQLDSLS